MEYKDFRITITTKFEDGNRVIVDTPIGGYGGVFKNPIAKSTWDDILIKSGLRARTNENLRGISKVKKTDNLDKIGNKISRALFKRDVLAAYAANIAIAKDKGYGLRIKIRIDPSIDEYAELMSLPWEFLYDYQNRQRIELLNRRAIIRDSLTPRPVGTLEVEPPLRVLAIVSDPKDYPALTLGREAASLKKMSQNIHNIDVKFLENATTHALDDEMAKVEEKEEKPYHVLHFMGHGGIYRNKGVLIFKDRYNKGVRVTGDVLSLTLTDSVRLVFLNACETGRVPKGDPFAAIPTELLYQGIPAVLSMQFPVSDEAAITFCKYFYKHLVKGNPVDQCVGNGRRKIRFSTNDNITAEWGTPVLFMRSTDGILFDIKKESKGRAAG